MTWQLMIQETKTARAFEDMRDVPKGKPQSFYNTVLETPSHYSGTVSSLEMCP